MSPGEHRVRFISRSLGIDVEERVFIESGITRKVYKGPKSLVP